MSNSDPLFLSLTDADGNEYFNCALERRTNEAGQQYYTAHIAEAVLGEKGSEGVETVRGNINLNIKGTGNPKAVFLRRAGRGGMFSLSQMQRFGFDVDDVKRYQSAIGTADEAKVWKELIG